MPQHERFGDSLFTTKTGKIYIRNGRKLSRFYLVKEGVGKGCSVWHLCGADMPEFPYAKTKEEAVLMLARYHYLGAEWQ